MSWADDQNKRERDEQDSQRQSDELRLRDERKLDEIGPSLFKKLKDYVDAEVKRFNAQRSGDGIFFIPDSSVANEQDLMSRIPSFSLRNKHARSPELYVKYSHSQRAIVWKCGSLEGWYRVHVEGYLYSSDGTPKTPEQVGNELLSLARNAEPTHGNVWA